MLRFKLFVEADNAAFGEDTDERNAEVARILRGLADRLDAGEVTDADETVLRDLNGNRVGSARWVRSA